MTQNRRIALNYSLQAQLADVFPAAFIALVACGVMLLFEHHCAIDNPWGQLFVQGFFGLVVVAALMLALRPKGLRELIAAKLLQKGKESGR